MESAPAPTTAPEATATAALVPREEPRIPIEPAPPAAAPTREPLFEPPVAIARVEPSYPKKALKGVTDPRVVLKLLVDDRGRITRVLVDKGLPGSELEAAAVSAVLRWQFRPAQRDGAPVEGWATAEFVFGE